MHEASVAAGILETVERVARKNGSSQIVAIRLQIGEFTCIQPDMLKFCLETLAEDTIAKGATVSIDRVKTRAVCNVCNAEFEVCDTEFKCPECSSSDIVLVSGRELLIESIEVQ